MRVGLSLMLIGTWGKHQVQTTLGWSTVSQVEPQTEAEVDESEQVDVTSTSVALGFQQPGLESEVEAWQKRDSAFVQPVS